MPKKSRHHHSRVHTRRHFVGLTLLSVACVFVVAVLIRAELRLSGEVLGAGGGGDLAQMFELHDCTSVNRLRHDDTTKLYTLYCESYDFLVESQLREGEWEVVRVERLH